MVLRVHLLYCLVSKSTIYCIVTFSLSSVKLMPSFLVSESVGVGLNIQKNSRKKGDGI